MTKPSFSQTVLIGITLFSMFFGAGNLIFAPFMGVQAGSSAWLALLGFICTAVILPISAVVIISRFKDAKEMLSTINPVFAVVFMALVYLLIGPCIAIPRTASTSFEMFHYLLGDSMAARIGYTVVFFACSALSAWHPGKLKDILGRFMGPVLVAMVLLLCGCGLCMSSSVPISNPSQAYGNNAFMTGFLEGYQTMDILAAFCFGIVILLNIKQMGITSTSGQVKLLGKAAFIAGILLAGVYALLAFTGMKYSSELLTLSNGALILSSLASMEFGAFGTVLISLIFLFACYNVCSGLLSCCAEFFYETTGKLSYIAWLVFFTIAGILVAIGGLDFILAFSAPILGWICPIAILLLFWGLFYGIHHKIAESAAMQQD